ncbi:hypothetical protein BU23DRAFT_580867 [Bimuria novae-zelandiae CBS 107.79]|uniref:Uncharacterized protein n=1 Tax=Bimuria novae-zelandiae CBS 107.79 TaxID=1447943 RepID=A0A6A5V5H5_9PLEO|nr:hypothetical protein BU23DRAFT_580867 [Bimuria novae-zelandiae CBS 107.79]
MLALPLQSEVLSNPNAPQQQHALPINIIVLLATQPRKRGRLLGLRNKRKANVYITKKKKADLKLAIKLRNNRVIITPSAPFKEVHMREVKGKTTKPYKKSRLEAILTIILAHLPTKLAPRYPEGTLLHWTTYHRYYYKELDISTLTYDLCFIISIQTNNTLMLRTATFLAHKEKMLEKAYYIFIIDASNIDNYKATLNLKQKGQGGKIKLIDINAPNRA